MKKEKLKMVKPYQDEYGKWFLRLEYDCEDDYRIYKAVIPKVEFPIPTDEIYLEPTGNSLITEIIDMKLGLYNGTFLPIYVDPISGVNYEVILLKEKVKELTIEEIEKKLGYKIKIVGSKEDKKNET